MDTIKSANINCIYEKDLDNTSKVGKAFENVDKDYLYVINDFDEVIGVYYLEEFCNSKKIHIDSQLPRNCNDISDEQKLCEKIKRLSPDEILYIRKEIIKSFGDEYVCCCSSKPIAEKIIRLIFPEYNINVSFIDKVNELRENANVLFLSFRKIKLYRKMHVTKINKFVMLNNLVSDSTNRKVFYSKYPDLIKYFRNAQVGFVYAVIPEKQMLTCLSQESLDRLAGFGKADYEFTETLLGGRDSGDYISCLDQNRLSKVINNGIYKCLFDCKSEFYNVIGGMRVTTNQPDEYKHKIYVFGPCTARGAMVEDSHTIASIIQSMVNDSNMPYIVMNCGVGGGTDLNNTYRYIVSLPICPGDIVILVEEGRFFDDDDDDDAGEIITISLADAFNKALLKNEWFLDRPAHCNTEANRIISKQIMNTIYKLDQKSNSQQDAHIVQLFKGKKKIFESSLSLKKYIKSLREHKFIIGDNDVVGAITMHCNPMTKGHMYLTETSQL